MNKISEIRRHLTFCENCKILQKHFPISLYIFHIFLIKFIFSGNKYSTVWTYFKHIVQIQCFQRNIYNNTFEVTKVIILVLSIFPDVYFSFKYDRQNAFMEMFHLKNKYSARLPAYYVNFLVNMPLSLKKELSKKELFFGVNTGVKVHFRITKFSFRNLSLFFSSQSCEKFQCHIEIDRKKKYERRFYA